MKKTAIFLLLGTILAAGAAEAREYGPDDIRAEQAEIRRIRAEADRYWRDIAEGYYSAAKDSSRSPEDRIKAISELVSRKSGYQHSRGLNQLMDLLTDLTSPDNEPDASVRAAALAALPPDVFPYSPEVRAAIIKAASSDPDPAVRAAALKAAQLRAKKDDRYTEDLRAMTPAAPAAKPLQTKALQQRLQGIRRTDPIQMF
ncbi:MAG: hypothetical protein HYZ75_02440 [Elusimicrobia bacterium]|nr:hypothetical protein [Elusimicrobiota bacterium]